MADLVGRIAEFLAAMWRELPNTVGNPAWLAAELPSWLLFSVVAGSISGLIASWLQKRREMASRRPYEGWVCEVIGFGDPPVDLYYEEVRKFDQSTFELGKFVKSNASGRVDLRLSSINEALGKWVFFDRKAKVIKISFPDIPEEQVNRWLKGSPKRSGISRQAGRVVFVTGHMGAREWAERQGLTEVEFISHMQPSLIDALTPGDRVIGTLPIAVVADICSRGAVFDALVLDIPQESRQRPLSADQMVAFNARLERYRVVRGE